ncbi:hypothetical protein VNI00_014717 [Paramarasmius palmivorus]|uniref:F-box domain-containing protein n=1 Tax=Paramarasmius palmivorus TaxID=297713 RepID=A0AAW0BQJ9_9AGAR
MSSSDRHIITQYLLDSEQELRDCQAEMNRLQAALLMLEGKQSRLKKNMEKYRYLLSPIRRLPTEILSAIFVLACDGNVLSPSHSSPAITLSRVCGQWRELSLSLPHLWASMIIRLEDWDESQGALESIVTMFIKRSGTAPLELMLDFAMMPPLDPFPALQPLVWESCRWRSLHLTVPLEIVTHEGLKPIKDRLPALKQLIVIGTGTQMYPSSLDLFKQCPKLESVSVVFTAGNIPLPSHQITTYTLSCIQNTDISTRLAQMSSLKELEFARVIAAGGHHISDTIESVLISQIHSDGDVESIFRYTTLPKLKTLRICSFKPGTQLWRTWNESIAKEFFHRSSCSITLLQLKWTPITDEQTSELLRVLPTLETLDIEECPNMNNRIITSRFLHSFANGDLVPNLQKASFAMNRASLDTGALTAALTCRWKPACEDLGVACLQDVDLRVRGDGAPISDLEMLRSFRDAGMHISISYTS